MKNLQIVTVFLLLGAASWYLLDGFAVRNYVAMISALFAVQVLLNDFLEGYLGRLKTNYFSILIGPGTVVHETSHALAAKITGCSVTKISLFSPGKKDGILGYVEYQQPSDRFQPVRTLIIGFAPFFGCGICLVAMLNYFAAQHPGMDLLDPGLVDIMGLDTILSTGAALLLRIIEQLIYLDLSDPVVLLVLYLEFSLALGSAPSPKDISDAFASLFDWKIEALTLVLITVCVILLTEYGATFGDAGGLASKYAMLAINWALLLLMLSAVMLILSLPVSFLIVETASIDGIKKAIPPVLLIAVYYLLTKYGRSYAEVSTEVVLVSSLLAYLVSLLLLRHPGLLMRRGASGD